MSRDPNQPDEAQSKPRAGTPEGAGSAEKSSGFTVLIWMAVIAALATVWLWLGRREPDPATAQSELPAFTHALGKAPQINTGWVEAVQPRDNPELAERRGEAARRMIGRQGLGVIANDRRPNWNAARSRAMPLKREHSSDAGAH